MERIRTNRHFSYLNLQFFLEDVERIIEVLTQGERFVVLDFDEWRLTSKEVHAFADRHSTVSKLNVTSGSKPNTSDILMTIEEGRAFVSLDPETPENRGLLAQLEEVFDRCKVPGDDRFTRWSAERWDTIVMQRRPREIKYPAGAFDSRKVPVASPDEEIAAGEENNRTSRSAASSAITKLLDPLPIKLSNPAEKSFIQESVNCVHAGCSRAAIVLGWCAVVHRFRRKVEALGFDVFNAASTKLKNQDSGKFKRWNKEFKIQTIGELQGVFDTDMIVILEGIGLIDDAHAKRLETLFQWRNNSAHPGGAPIGEPHVIAFFTDILEIVLSNPKFDV